MNLTNVAHSQGLSTASRHRTAPINRYKPLRVKTMTAQTQKQSKIIRLLNAQLLGKKLLATTAMTMAGALAMSSSAYAVEATELPTDGVVTGGAASISYDGANLTVTQEDTNRTVIDWSTFNIGQDAAAEFQQLNNQSVTVNKVGNNS